MAKKITILNTEIQIGDTVKIHHKVKEGEKERIQIFEGILISIRGREVNKSFTVRRIASANIGVERIWPVYSPSIVKVEVKRKGSVRRAKLYYLRKRLGKEAVRVKGVKKKKEEVKKVNEKKKPRKSRRKPSPKISAK